MSAWAGSSVTVDAVARGVPPFTFRGAVAVSSGPGERMLRNRCPAAMACARTLATAAPARARRPSRRARVPSAAPTAPSAALIATAMSSTNSGSAGVGGGAGLSVTLAYTPTAPPSSGLRQTLFSWSISPLRRGNLVIHRPEATDPAGHHTARRNARHRAHHTVSTRSRGRAQVGLCRRPRTLYDQSL